MNNAELIKALREAREHFWTQPQIELYPMMEAAADALEAAKQRIAELVADKKILINVVKDKSDFHATKDAMRIADLEARLPKEGEWIWDIDGMDWGIGSWKCKNCHARPNTYWQGDSTINPLTFAGSSYCPNCGAKMRGENDDKN